MQQEGDGAEAGQAGLHCVDDSGDGDGGLGSGARDYDVELERCKREAMSEARRGEGGGAMKVVWWRRQSGGGLPLS